MQKITFKSDKIFLNIIFEWQKSITFVKKSEYKNIKSSNKTER